MGEQGDNPYIWKVLVLMKAINNENNGHFLTFW